MRTPWKEGNVRLEVDNGTLCHRFDSKFWDLFYFPLWLFFNFLISCLALLCLPVCKPEAVRQWISIRAEVVQEREIRKLNNLSPPPLKKEFSLYQKL